MMICWLSHASIRCCENGLIVCFIFATFVNFPLLVHDSSNRLQTFYFLSTVKIYLTALSIGRAFWSDEQDMVIITLKKF